MNNQQIRLSQLEDEILLNDDYLGLFIPSKPPNYIESSQYMKIYQLLYKKLIKISSDNLDIPYLKDCLTKYCNLILILNGQPVKKEITNDTYIDNLGDCYFLGNKPSQDVGCKTLPTFEKNKKEYVMNLFKNLLLYLFLKIQNTNPELLNNTDLYIELLTKSIEFYCHFIGSKELGSIYVKYVKDFIEEFNSFFPEPLILNRCSPDETGYGCSRMITHIRRITYQNTDTNKEKILLFSTINDGTNSGYPIETNFRVNGGGKKYSIKSNLRINKAKSKLKSKAKSKLKGKLKSKFKSKKIKSKI